ncbi:MAG TPA: DUF429 domain-containing protein [Vicinamibacteria bacterium]|nr:DUF429 domain-containing protein [Vicinamibacteria bacterium]
MRALGVDVSERRGLDLVLLDGSPGPAALRSNLRPETLAELVRELRPDVVAVDSPPAWGARGGSRRAEQQLRRLAIHSYGTPSDPRKRDHAFYGWMKVGFRVFAVTGSVGFPIYRRGAVRGTTVEVFPHATAVVLADGLPPAAVPKHTWRAAVLRAQGLDVALLRSADLIDAALAALTGLYALRGEFVATGDPEEGVIVLPIRALPPHPYRRCTQPPAAAPQLTLPGLSPCACGQSECRAMTSHEFAPGHDAKRKAQLWAQVRHGAEAREELRRRGWELPPELK